MKTKVQTENWQEIAPKLAQMEKINPFVTPEGYFDTLSDRITQRMDQERKATVKGRIIPMWTRYAAAACLTFVLGVTLYLNLRPNTPAKINWNEIPDQEIIAYLEMNMEETDARMIINAMDEKLAPELTSGVSEQELATYINQYL